MPKMQLLHHMHHTDAVKTDAVFFICARIDLEVAGKHVVFVSMLNNFHCCHTYHLETNART